MRRGFTAVLIVSVLGALSGCGNSAIVADAVNRVPEFLGEVQLTPPPTPTEHLVFLIPGIEGRAQTLAPVREALRDAGVHADVRTFNWTRPFGALDNLMNYGANRERALRIARELETFALEHPCATIDVVGYSGGAGLAVFSLEELPESVRVRNVLLVQGALSPFYDLTGALRHVDGRLVNFHSPRDWLILSAGTNVFGTMDGERLTAAGRYGFDLHAAGVPEELHDRVQQVEWTPAMRESGHRGNHASISGYRWNRDYVAPLLHAEESTAVETLALARK